MNCEYCGSNIPAGASNCPGCGAACTPSQPASSQQTAGAERICIFCGNIITDAEETACPKCGFDIQCSFCKKVYKHPHAICPKCKTETEALNILSEYLIPQRLIEKKDKYAKITFYLIVGILFLGIGSGGFFGAMMDWRSLEFWGIMIVIASICVISLYLFPFICEMLIEKLFTTDSEYQSKLQMLIEDDSFFQSKLQEYISKQTTEEE